MTLAKLVRTLTRPDWPSLRLTALQQLHLRQISTSSCGVTVLQQLHLRQISTSSCGVTVLQQIHLRQISNSSCGVTVPQQLHLKQISNSSCGQKRFTSRIKLQQFAGMSYVDYAPKATAVPDILLQRTGPAHLSAVQALLRDSFFQDEPLVAALGGRLDRRFMDDEAKLILEQVSLVAIEAISGRIVGAAVNRTVLPQEMIEWPKEIDQIQCARTRKLARFWYNISVVPNIFTTFSAATYFELTFLVTARAARGKGLASLLVTESLALARETRAPLAVIYCTNVASARLVEKLAAMKRIGGRRVEEYFEADDRQEVREKLTPFNDEIRVYAISLDETITV